MKTPAAAISSIRSFSVSPAVRVSLGLTALMLASLLALDLIFGILPDETALLRQVRERTSENLAIQIAAILGTSDLRPLQATLGQAIVRDKQLLSIAVRREDGTILAQAGEHARHWKAGPDDRSSLENVRVPLLIGNSRWGTVEVSFQSAAPESIWGWLGQPLVFLVISLSLCGFVLFSLYLRRVLEHLDPSAVIPERVRQAFDSFTEGVLVIDPVGRIMLANATFRGWASKLSENLHGRRVQDLPWLKAALPGDSKSHPWMMAMSQAQPRKSEYLEFKKEQGEVLKTNVNCSPIQDGRGRVRGCIVTFDNVTELERINRQLTAAMRELQDSRAQIEKQNEELRRLATRDSLTGCLNRRAFHEQLLNLFAEAKDNGTSLTCIMTDIDYFKTFNDRFGHAAGDTVLQNVARFLFSGLRETDLLCRYGGEEFCIILPGIDMEAAQVVAERLRSTIEARTAVGLRSLETTKVTSSFGVAALVPEIQNPGELIQRADKALYAAKDAGRNCVEVWRAELETASA